MTLTKLPLIFIDNSTTRKLVFMANDGRIATLKTHDLASLIYRNDVKQPGRKLFMTLMLQVT